MVTILIGMLTEENFRIKIFDTASLFSKICLRKKTCSMVIENLNTLTTIKANHHFHLRLSTTQFNNSPYLYSNSSGFHTGPALHKTKNIT